MCNVRAWMCVLCRHLHIHTRAHTHSRLTTAQGAAQASARSADQTRPAITVSVTVRTRGTHRHTRAQGDTRGVSLVTVQHAAGGYRGKARTHPEPRATHTCVLCVAARIARQIGGDSRCPPLDPQTSSTQALL
jgi:hypothetical protein